MGQHAGEPFLWVDEREGFHVAWRQNTPFVFDQTLFYACSADGGASWSPPIPASDRGDVAIEWLGISDRGERLPAGVYLWNIAVRGETYRTTHRALSVKLSR